MTITSRDNPLVRQAKRLLSDAKARRRERLFVIEGARLCEDAVRSGVTVRTALLTPEALRDYPRPARAVADAAAETVEISPAVARALGDTVSPQGVFCLCEWLDNRGGLDTIKKNAPHSRGVLALENVRDPANLGAVIRTAEALGLLALVLSDGCCDPYNPKVLRGSMGGVFRLPLIQVGEMAPAVAGLRGAGLDCYACVVDADARPVTEIAWRPGSVCVIGNEANGLTHAAAEACTARVTVPMAGRAESLNAAMAAGLVMWEMVRGRR